MSIRHHGFLFFFLRPSEYRCAHDSSHGYDSSKDSAVDNYMLREKKVSHRSSCPPFHLCQAEHSPAVSTSAAFVCQSKEACGKGYGSDLFSARADAGAEVMPSGSPVALAVEAAAEAAAEGVYYAARGLSRTDGGENDDMARFRGRVSSGMSGVLAYENAALQAKARAVLPAEGAAGGTIVQKGAEMAAAGGFSDEEGLARALLRYMAYTSGCQSVRYGGRKR